MSDTVKKPSWGWGKFWVFLIIIILASIISSASVTSLIFYLSRDQIVEEWKRIKHKVNFDEAYIIAETVVKECESYSYIDPFFVIACQNVESSYRPGVMSAAGAIGLNQIMPSTGRLLAGYFGIEYTDSLLYNIQVSTKFAIKLFDILYAQYKSWEVALADYNGGPWQAYYYRKKRESLAKETEAYVPNVLQKKKQLDSAFSKYKINEEMYKILKEKEK